MARPIYSAEVVETFKDIVCRSLVWLWNSKWNPTANDRPIGPLRERVRDTIADLRMIFFDPDKPGDDKEEWVAGKARHAFVRIRQAVPLRAGAPPVAADAALTQYPHPVPPQPAGRDLQDALRNPSSGEDWRPCRKP